MKKAVLGLFIALVAVSLLFVALYSCDGDLIASKEIVAHAATSVSVATPNGIATPNYLPYCDYRDIMRVYSAPSVNDDVGIYYVATNQVDSSTNDMYPSVVGSSILTLPGEFTIYYIFEVPETGASIFGFSVNRITGNNFTPTIYYTDGITTWTNTQISITGSFQIKTITLPSATYGGKKLMLYFSPTEQCIFRNVKLSNGYGQIGSFIVPEVLGMSNDDSDTLVYQNYGIYRPNLLSNSDFFEYPIYNGLDTYEQWSDDGVLSDKWVSNLPSSNFNYQDNRCIVQFNSTGFLRYNSSLTLTAPIYTLSFCLKSPNGNQTVTFSYGYGNTELYSEALTVLQDDMTVYSFALDSTEFSFSPYFRFVASSAHVSFYYIKLEVGDGFTGYIYPNHDLSTVVRDNYLNNYDFSSVPSTSSSSSYGEWKSTGIPNSLVLLPSGGLRVLTASSYQLDYDLVDSLFAVGDHLVFALRCVTDQPFLITITGNNDTLLVNTLFLSSSSAVDLIVPFEADTRLSISLKFETITDFTLYYAKLEQGDNFTGFVPSFRSSFESGYSSGYSQGYVDGLNDYAVFYRRLEFNNVENPSTVNEGWSSWGFSSAQELYDSYITMNSLFYRDINVQALSSEKVGIVSNNDLDGVAIFISRDADFDIENITSSTNYVALSIFDHYCTLTINDSLYPQSWNPLEYPTFRVVDVTINRNFLPVLEKYQASAEKIGYDKGFTAGEQKGYQDGKAYGQGLITDMITGDSWVAFINAFIDIPVRVITSLLDYDFFGFNLLNIVKYIILFSLMFMTIRLLTKGKISG